MAESKATLRFLLMSPRKVRLVVDMVRGTSVSSALKQLTFSSKQAARPVRKLIESAVANAVNNHGMNKESLMVSTITVDGGPTIKRSTPRAQGRATPIRKRTSHINVILTEKGGVAEEKQVEEKTVEKVVAKKPTAQPKVAKPKAEAKTAAEDKKKS